MVNDFKCWTIGYGFSNIQGSKFLNVLMYCEGGSLEPLVGNYQVIDVSFLPIVVFDVDSNLPASS